MLPLLCDEFGSKTSYIGMYLFSANANSISDKLEKLNFEFPCPNKFCEPANQFTRIINSFLSTCIKKLLSRMALGGKLLLSQRSQSTEVDRMRYLKCGDCMHQESFTKVLLKKWNVLFTRSSGSQHNKQTSWRTVMEREWHVILFLIRYYNDLK